MKKFLFLVFGLTAMAVQAAAQYYNPKFGKVSAEEVSMATCAMDPEADAMYLYDIGDVYYSNNGMMIYDVQVRIKIFKKEAVGLADVEYPYYTNTSPSEEVSRIDACTYNMVDGKVVKTQMSKKNIFKEKVSDRLSRVKFSLPDVREGSVIEYKFSFASPRLSRVPDLVIQHDYPVLHSKMRVSFPEFIGYHVDTKGHLHLNIEQEDGNTAFMIGNFRYNIKEVIAENDNIPALKQEPMVWCLDDYRAGLDVEVSGMELPLLDIHEYYSQTWADVNKALAESDLGDCQKAKNPLKEEVKEIMGKDGTDEEKIRSILKLVSGKIKHDGKLGLVPNTPANVVKKGTGNMADINNLLSVALRDAGYENNLILLNPRPLGRLSYFPTIQQIGSFIVRAKVPGGKYHYLDASDEDSELDVLNPALLVGNARIYGRDDENGWVDLSSLTPNQQQVIVLATLDADGTMKGNYRNVMTNQHAYDFNSDFRKAGSEDKYIEDDIEKENGITADSVAFEGRGTANVTENVTFTKEAEASGDFFYINPTIIPFMSSNPFDQQERHLPIEFETTENVTMQVTLMIPEGYAVEELPKNVKATACNGDAMFRYMVQATGNSISARLSLNINRVLFSTEEYGDLRQLFAMAAQTCNSKIIVKKL